MAPADDLVHALKYEGWKELADFMGSAMSSVMSAHSPDIAVSRDARRVIVVPIPTTAHRAANRGYNQAQLLAEGVATGLGLPLYPALDRVSSERSQTTLSSADRRENVRGAFELVTTGARALAGAHIVLVDDVLTTGSTASEAAVTLARGGAETVTLVAFARALTGAP